MLVNRYKETISEVADAMLDEPIGSMEKAMFWIEYVIKHRGAKYLRAPAADISWFKFLLIDVLLFILVITLSLTVITYKLLTYILHISFNRFHKKPIKQKST